MLRRFCRWQWLGLARCVDVGNGLRSPRGRQAPLSGARGCGLGLGSRGRAAACRLRPVAAAVGGGHFGSFVPYPDDATPANARFVFQRMECYHCFWRCHKRSTKLDVFPCVGAISEERVWAEMAGLLKAVPAAAAAEAR